MEASAPPVVLVVTDFVVMDEVLALNKPAGLSMATSSREGRSEERVLARLLGACGAMASGPLFLVHRLDVGTTGVVLVARSAETHRRLVSAFQERRVSKTYRALVWGHPVPAKGDLEEPLGRDPKDGRKMRVREDGKKAVTRYETKRRFPGLADLALMPETGRTHQIRVHLAAGGHPVVGDDLYGGATRWRGVRDPRLRSLLASVSHPLLHAERLEVPELGLILEVPLPKDYEEALKAAQRAK